MKQLIELVVIATVFAATVFVAAPASAQTTVNIHMNKLGSFIGAPELPVFLNGSDEPVCIIKEEGHCSFSAPAGNTKIQIGSRVALRNGYVAHVNLDLIDGETKNLAMVKPSASSITMNFGLIGMAINTAIEAPANPVLGRNVNYDVVEAK